MTWKNAKPSPTTAPWQSAKPSHPWRKGGVTISFQRMLQLLDLTGSNKLELGVPELAGQTHYFGDFVETFYCVWSSKHPEHTFVQHPDPRDGGLEEFFKWLNDVLAKRPLDPKIKEILDDQTTSTLKQEQFLKGVKYLTKHAERVKYQIKINIGLLYRRSEIFDSSKHTTVNRGAGWAIWVRGPDGTFYSHSHKYARFHHSSFLGGTAILAGGEWRVNSGRIVLITGKSGHYKPGVESLWDAVRALYGLGACDASSAVILYERATKKPQYMPAPDFVHIPVKKLLMNFVADPQSVEISPYTPVTTPKPQLSNTSAKPTAPPTAEELQHFRQFNYNP